MKKKYLSLFATLLLILAFLMVVMMRVTGILILGWLSIIFLLMSMGVIWLIKIFDGEE